MNYIFYNIAIVKNIFNNLYCIVNLLFIIVLILYLYKNFITKTLTLYFLIELSDL